MLTTIEGSFIGGQLSRSGQFKQLQIKIPGDSAAGQGDRVQGIKVPKPLRTIVGSLVASNSYLKLQVQTGHHHLKVVNVLTLDHQTNEAKQYISPVKVQVCSKGSCHKRGSNKICAVLEVMVQERNLHDVVFVEKVSCLKECKHAPNVRFKPSGAICHQASSSKVLQLLEPMLAK